MAVIRRTLGGVFAMFGAHYCVISAWTLVRIPSVTAAWVANSGDPDFKFDADMFSAWITVGAVAVGTFGFRTVIKGIAVARGEHRSWLFLALGALPLHWFWFMYRMIGAGHLGRQGVEIAIRNNAMWFGAICAAYVLMAVIMTRRASPHHEMTQAQHGQP